jgi:LysM repeat protein
MATRFTDNRPPSLDDGVTSARRDLAFALFGLGVLALLLPSPVAVAHLTMGRPATIDGDAVTVAALVVAAVLVWTVLGLAAGIAACAALARLPGRIGRFGRAALGHLVPHRWRAWTGALIGVTLLAGTAACGADSSPASDRGPTTGPATVETLRPGLPGATATPNPTAAGPGVLVRIDGLDWPTAASTPVAEQPPTSDAGPTTATITDLTAAVGTSPARPSASPPTSSVGAAAPPAATPAPTTTAHPAAPGPAHAVPARPTPPAAPAAVASTPLVITVQAGDSLWTIAARQLPAGAADLTVDATWRSWYATNRAVIGPDPDVILPGQRLRAPGAGATP